ncbi:MAG: NAD(P)/FAD-dependent oxidoreductase [Sporolactobacillus sp.]
MNDPIIIGGGPAGLMAAIAAAECGAGPLLLEKGDKFGRKLAISGGGRCNVTNAMPTDALIQHIPGNGRFLYSALSTFNNTDIMAFFQRLGISLKEEDHGRVFPASDRATQVVDALTRYARQLGVSMRLNAKVDHLRFAGNACVGVTLASGEMIDAPQLIIATGGKSVPKTGSSGDGYGWARTAGHTVTPLYPTEVPLISPATFIRSKALQGLALRDVAVTLIDPNGKAIQTHRWDVLFTHVGLSGPAILRLSQFVVKAFKKYRTDTLPIRIDVYPDTSVDALYTRLLGLAEDAPDKSVQNAWKAVAPERYLLLLLEGIDLAPSTRCRHIKRDVIRKMVEQLKAFSVPVNGTLPIEKAFVTGGGVSLKEIDPRSMASRKIKGLFFCGEILDVHGYTGGYNITAAFTTGHAAGIAAAQSPARQ